MYSLRNITLVVPQRKLLNLTNTIFRGQGLMIHAPTQNWEGIKYPFARQTLIEKKNRSRSKGNQVRIVSLFLVYRTKRLF